MTNTVSGSPSPPESPEYAELMGLLREAATADPAFGVTRAELDEDLRPELYVGRAPQQVDEFLGEWVAPALARYPDAEGEAAPELSV